MELPGWNEMHAALLPAVLGAALALSLLLASRIAGRLLRRLRGARLPKEGAVRGLEEAHLELRALAGEVERRLDSKLDRLESLLNEADRVLEAAPHPPAPGVAAGPAKTRPPRLLPSGRWDPLDAMSQADRQRVVELASLGELPETIAHSVGLLRGEVDLILRLHRSAERPQET